MASIRPAHLQLVLLRAYKGGAQGGREGGAGFYDDGMVVCWKCDFRCSLVAARLKQAVKSACYVLLVPVCEFASYYKARSVVNCMVTR